MKYRQTSVQENLWLRSRIISAIRRFFTDRDYLEVETPCRTPAPAPEAHIDPVDSGEWFLQTSPELYMKRLLAAGYPRLFQISKCFRGGERGTRHLPEFTMLEWYAAQTCYMDMMGECEKLIRFAANECGFGDKLACGVKQIHLAKPWDRMTVSEAFDRYASVSLEKALSEDRFDETLAIEIEPRLGMEKPVFLYDYPASMGALSKLKPEDKSVAERFELYVCGLELCNGFGELRDRSEQRERFEKERKFRESAGKKVCPMPEKFLESLDDMPDASGNALGVDRLVMLFAGTERIDDVVAFTPEES